MIFVGTQFETDNNPRRYFSFQYTKNKKINIKENEKTKHTCCSN